MRTGERITHRPRRRGCRGFTYVALLLALAIGAAAAAGLAEQWTTVAHRDREAELIFRGQQIAAAIAAYRAATPGEAKAWPQRLEDLVNDERTQPARHHLRRLYADPFTGRPDWAPIADAQGNLQGVHSRSNVPALATLGVKPAVEGDVVRESDRRFTATRVP